MHAPTKATTVSSLTTTTAAATSTITFIENDCKAKSIKIKITKVYQYTGYQKDISAMS